MRNDAEKRKEELSATLRFFEFRGWEVRAAENRDSPQPDIVLEAHVEGCWKRLGVELTQYAAEEDDAEEKPGTEAAQGRDHGRLKRRTVVYWQSIRERILQRVTCYPQLADVWGQVLFRGNSAPTPNQKDAFADECVAFASEAVSGSAWASARNLTLKTFPPECRLLSQYVRCFQLGYCAGGANLWQVGTRAGSFGGPGWDWVVCALKAKEKKLSQYDTCGLDEVWLLVYCLPPEGRGRHVGTTLMSPRPEFLDPPPEEVVVAVKGSGFRRVFLYNHMCGWDMELCARPDESSQ